MKDSVAIYGGFPNSGSPTMSERDWESNATILSGDIGASGNSDNSKRVITSSGLSSSAVLDGFTVTLGNNDAGTGGGMHNNNSSPTLTNCTFSSNSASYGGGMANYSNSSPTLTNCTFSSNSASSYGGGMYNLSNSSPTLTNCTFANNSATDAGGGMLNENSSPTLTNCTFTNNSADYGGGMLNFTNSFPTLINCTFTNNSADYGGGMYNYNSSPTLTNCTITNNSAGQGSGIYNDYSTPIINNSIVWDDVSGSYTAKYSLIKGSSDTSNGNINATGHTAEAIFNNPSGGDYTLNASCDNPVINAGDNGLYPTSAPEEDLAGNDRIYNSTIDLGAYELQAECSNDDIIAKLFEAFSDNNIGGLRWSLLETIADRCANFPNISLSHYIRMLEGLFKYIHIDSSEKARILDLLDQLKAAYKDGSLDCSNYISLKASDNDLDYSQNNSGFKAFPNPVKSQLTIETGLENLESLEVYNTLGQLIYNRQFDGETNRYNFDRKDMKPGVYILKVDTQSKKYTEKMIFD